MLNRLARFLKKVPLALPLLCCVGALLAPWGYGVVLLSILCSLYLRRWKLFIACSLCALVAGLQQAKQEHEQRYTQAVLCASPELELNGTVLRTYAYSTWLRLDDLPATIELRGEARCPVERGDHISFTGSLIHDQEEKRTGIFNRAQWLQQQGIAASIELHELNYLGKTYSWARVMALSENIRAVLAARLMPAGKENDPRRQLLCALVLGEKSAAAPELMDIFKWSGTMHTFAVSGLHVGLISGLLYLLFRVLRLPPRAAVGLIILLVGAYVFVTGMAVSALRAYLLLALLLLGRQLKRPIHSANLWCAAALFLLLLNPHHLFQAGFQLSFCIYAGIIFALEWSKNDKPWFGPDAYIPHRIYTKFEQLCWRAEQSVRGIFVVSLSAWLVSIPLSIYHFGAWSSYGFLSNICLSPLLPFIMSAGICVIVLSGVPILAALAESAALYLSTLMVGIGVFFAELPQAYQSAQAPQEPAAAIIIAGAYGQHYTQLGNPGLLIGCGTQNQARHLLRPQIFAMGFTPTCLLQEPPKTTRQEGAKLIKALWPKLKVMAMQDLPLAPIHLKSQQSQWTIYPAPRDIKRPLSNDATPLVMWECGERKLLYIGDASWSTLMYWQGQGANLNGQELILGYNKRQTFCDEAWPREHGFNTIYLLPSVPTNAYPNFHTTTQISLKQNETQLLIHKK